MAIHFTPSTPVITDLTLPLHEVRPAGPEQTEQRSTFWPAEWYPQSGVQLTWPHAATDWAPILDEVTKCYVTLAFEIASREQLLIVTPEPEAVSRLLNEKLPSRLLLNIRFAKIDTNDTWARDHAFLTLITSKGPRLLDFQFNGWGGKFNAELDNAINLKLVTPEQAALPPTGGVGEGPQEGPGEGLLSIEADLVLVATGRAANIEGLNLEATSVQTDRRGIVVNPETFEAAPHVYAIGDVNGRQMLAHAATYQGLRAVNHILGIKDNIRLDIMPAAVFTHPEAASVGPTEDQSFTVHKAIYRANGKALATEASEGLVKIFTDDSDRIVAAHILGSHAADMVQEIAALMNCDVTLSHLRDMVHIHPTLAEMLTEVS